MASQTGRRLLNFTRASANPAVVVSPVSHKSINMELRDNGRILRLRLERLSDRYEHFVEIADGDHWQPVLCSVEGTATDHWPASPPIREIVANSPSNQTEDSTPLLATGAAGTTYWSIAIARTAGSFDFDHACRRAQQSANFIGSTYEFAGSIVSAISTSVTIETESGCLSLRVFDNDASHGRLQAYGNRVEICPNRQTVDKTLRWKYQIGFLSSFEQS